MNDEPTRHEFTAIIEGIELPPQVVEKLSKAVQKAVLIEIANIDLRGSINLDIPESVPSIAQSSGSHLKGLYVKGGPLD
jgi:hypothetical protein